MNIDPQILAPILTVLFGGVLSGIITYSLNARKSERELLRQKLELLYTHTHKYIATLIGHYIQYYPVVNGVMSLNELYDLQIKSAEKSTSTHEQIEMLIAVYFPKVQSAYDQLLVARDQLAEFHSNFSLEYKRGKTDSAKHKAELKIGLDALNIAEKALRAKILNQAAWINQPWWKLW